MQQVFLLGLEGLQPFLWNALGRKMDLAAAETLVRWDKAERPQNDYTRKKGWLEDKKTIIANEWTIRR